MMPILLFVGVMIGDGKPDAKELTPKQKRDAAIKAVQERMEPIEQRLAYAKKDLAAAQKAPVGRLNAFQIPGPGKAVYASFRTQEDKAKHVAIHAKEVEECEAELKPLEAELKAVRRMKFDGTDPKPKR